MALRCRHLRLVSATATLLILTGPRVHAAKPKARPGWLCHAASTNADFYWTIYADRGTPEKISLSWRKPMGQFSLSASYAAETLASADPAPLLTISWTNPPADGQRLPDRHIELIGASVLHDGDEALAESMWFGAKEQYRNMLQVGWKQLSGFSTKTPDLAIVTRDRHDRILDQQPLPPAALEEARGEIRAALLAMAKSDYRSDKACTHSDDLTEIIIMGG